MYSDRFKKLLGLLHSTSLFQVDDSFLLTSSWIYDCKVDAQHKSGRIACMTLNLSLQFRPLDFVLLTCNCCEGVPFKDIRPKLLPMVMSKAICSAAKAFPPVVQKQTSRCFFSRSNDHMPPCLTTSTFASDNSHDTPHISAHIIFRPLANSKQIRMCIGKHNPWRPALKMRRLTTCAVQSSCARTRAASNQPCTGSPRNCVLHYVSRKQLQQCPSTVTGPIFKMRNVTPVLWIQYGRQAAFRVLTWDRRTVWRFCFGGTGSL